MIKLKNMRKKQIIPTLLASNFDELLSQSLKVEGVFPAVQIDVMDGNLVQAESFKEIERVKELANKFRFELHLMVDDPIAELEKWQNVPNIYRVIFHIEGRGNTEKTIDKIKEMGFQAGVALNPETPISDILPFLEKLSTILFMTVHPGRQGAIFLPEVCRKIEDLARLDKKPEIAVDGGINLETINLASLAGANIFFVGSCLLKADNVKKTKDKLLFLAKGEK